MITDFTRSYRKLLVIFAVILGGLMSVDLLILQGGVDGIGLIERYQGTVVVAERTVRHQRVSKHGSQGAIYEAVPSMSIAFSYLRQGDKHPSTSGRYILLNGGDPEIPVAKLKNPDLIKVGTQVPVYYVRSTGLAFVELGAGAAIGYWLKAYALFALLGFTSLSIVSLLKWVQKRAA
ncbi:MAG: hypothetical protein EOO15_14125 [Chitinophagaceae bacterium]|nr:MAG: hypothetical protein EOO15_14125 [Chitinophagaceae bacterium]